MMQKMTLDNICEHGKFFNIKCHFSSNLTNLPQTHNKINAQGSTMSNILIEIATSTTFYSTRDLSYHYWYKHMCNK